ncbi:epimerase [Aureimonas sp. Leaf454]|uniref:NAD-dependent epimerase/dehydratase family protein n=1 Tax=Aureimonas sp. Leaf454 TaxID=1736381 RepID=UPI0006FABD23|nr:NAD-dependent epimerase/dehydratase family protein [Aureimonas sp. Leaf454]KQT51012.1 epimerase [Aureimonas sp. Leaf454]
MKRIIVTGGNGYVGRELVRLLYDDHEVHVLDKVAPSALRFRADERAKFHFEQIDLTHEPSVERAMADISPDVIVHLAAIHYIPECEDRPIAALATNLLGTVAVLAKAPVGCRFVFASSGAVYKPDLVPHREASLQQPSDIYGLSKLHGEHYVANFAAKRSLDAAVVRLFNVVGPGETNPHLLPELVAQLKAGHRTIRLGNLWPKRDYIHVKDAALGFRAVALKDSSASGEVVTVNLGTSASYSVVEVLEKLRSVSQTDFSIEEDPDRLRKVDRPFLAADTSRIQALFGWNPRFTIDDAMADLWREPELAESLTARYHL